MPLDRRRILQLAAAGAFGAAGVSGLISSVLAQGRSRQGVNSASGEVLVNGKPAQPGTPVEAGDRVRTSRRGNATVVVGEDAFMLRANSEVAFSGSKARVVEMKVESGGVLSVFGRKAVDIKAQNATIGIRGTGAYVECMDERVYFCLCYGEARLAGPGYAGRTVKTRQHEEPLFLQEKRGVLTVVPGPFLNHTDDELILLEGLVGRQVPFSGPYPG